MSEEPGTQPVGDEPGTEPVREEPGSDLMPTPEAAIPAEIGRKHARGSVAASRKTFGNPQKASNAGQFYVCFAAQPGLDGEYTVFGQVVEGMDVVDRLKRGTGLNGAMVPPGSGDKMLKVEVLEVEAAPPNAK